MFVPIHASAAQVETKVSHKNRDLTQEEKAWLTKHPSIKIAGPAAFPPFYYHENNQLKGISADYIRFLSARLGIKIEITKPQSWQQVLEKSKEKEVDLIACLAKTAGREKYLTYTDPYLSFPLVIITRDDAPFISGVRDLHQKKVSSIRKNIIPERLEKEGINFIPYFVSSSQEGLNAVSFGKADAHIENLAAASYLIHKNGLTNLKIAAPTHWGDYNLHMAVRDDWPILVRIFNKSLASITPNQHNKIRSTWLSVRFEHGIDKNKVVGWIGIIILFSAIFISVVLYWNRLLKKEVQIRKQTETDLRKSESRFREIIEEVSEIAIQGYDEQRRVTFWNQASEDLYGFTKKEALGKQLEDLIIPDGMREQVIRFHRDWLEKGIKIPAGELTLVDKNKNDVAVYSSHAMHQSASSKEMFCIDVDLNPIKQAKAALEDADTINEKLIEESPIGISIYDEEGQCIGANKSVGKIVGATRVQVLGQNYNKIETWKETGLFEVATAAVREDRTLRKEVKLDTSFGKKIAIDCYFVPFKKQEKTHLMLMVTDIRERNKIERALRESEAKYRDLFKRAPAGMYEIDFRNVKFVSVNSVMCEYSGYSEDDFLTMDPLEILTPESREKFLKRMKLAVKGKKLSDNVEYEIIKKDGTLLTVILKSDFIYEDGVIVGARTVAHDITELKKAQLEKIRAQKIADEHSKMVLVGQIAGKMAHDFNNILSIILGTTELAMLDCEETDTKQSLNMILEQAIRGKNLTRNLVIFAKDQEPRQEFFFIQDKINLVLDLLKKDLNGIQITTQVDPQIPKLLADPGMIEHALVNIIQNAVHALSKTPAPQISIHTVLYQGLIRLVIRDNGCGIPKKQQSRIYEPSFTLKGSRDITGSYKPEIKGTGYGMSNVKKYIEQHHGSIKVESKDGEGTAFIIEIPITKQKLTPDEIKDLKKETAFSRKSILLVEDEIPVSDIQTKILTHEPCNHQVDVAIDADTALELFQSRPYDLISLDYILPGEKNGLDVYQKIRQTNKNIPILFVSGNIEFLESIKLLKQKDPAIDHISKPCLNREYIKHINHLLERVSLQNQPF